MENKKRGRGRPKGSTKKPPVVTQEKEVKNIPSQPEVKPEVKKEEPVSSESSFENQKKEFSAQIPDDLKEGPGSNAPEKKDQEKGEEDEQPEKEEGGSGSDNIRVVGFIDGTMILLASDWIFPGLIKSLYSFVDKRAKKVNVKKIEMDSDDHEKILPLAEKVAEYISFKANPIVAFTILCFIRYGFTFKFALDEIKERESERGLSNKKPKGPTEDATFQEVGNDGLEKEMD